MPPDDPAPEAAPDPAPDSAAPPAASRLAQVSRWVGVPSRPTPKARAHLRPQQLLRRHQLRAAAARLYAEFGVAAVGIEPVALAAKVSRRTAHADYVNRDEMLYEMLGEHILALNAAVCAAFDATASAPPLARQEAVAAAWLTHVARHRDEHRSWLFCKHLLVTERRRSIEIRHRILMETMMEPLLAATPGLAARTDAVESLMATLASLLNDTGFWPEPPPPAELLVRAQRIAGMMRAAASAEMAGFWPGLGPADGGPAAVAVLECSAVRTRWREVLAGVAAGTEVVVTRHGQRLARLVRAG